MFSSLQSDIMMLEFFSTLRRRMAELETLDNMDCPECSGPPPMFRLPPPPRPPFLTEASFCSEAPLAELEDCVAIPMIDASYHANPALQNTALIITCAVILLLMAAIVSIVFWKHKRKVQNLLPCKSAAAAAAAAGRGRVLTNGQPLAGTGTVAGSTLLYEDLMDSTVHSQIHNHLPLPQPGLQPTIEVRGTNPSRQQVSELQPPHHLDYLDYRDPRSILCATNKPSRAALGGGYRTPQALLAKSLTRSQNSALRPNTSENAHLLLLASHNVLATRVRNISVVPVSINGYRSANSARPFTLSNATFAPTHQSPVSELDRRPNDVAHANTSLVNLPTNHRRLSVDSEGYSYIDFDNRSRNRLEGIHSREFITQNSDPSCQRLLGDDAPPIDRERSESIDETYTYIDSIYSQVHHVDRRAIDEEVCPLCTMQQIHDLLALPDQICHNQRNTTTVKG